MTRQELFLRNVVAPCIGGLAVGTGIGLSGFRLARAFPEAQGATYVAAMLIGLALTGARYAYLHGFERGLLRNLELEGAALLECSRCGTALSPPSWAEQRRIKRYSVLVLALIAGPAAVFWLPRTLLGGLVGWLTWWWLVTFPVRAPGTDLRTRLLRALLEHDEVRDLRKALSGGSDWGGPSYGGIYRELEGLEAADLVVRSEIPNLHPERLRERRGHAAYRYTLTDAGRAAAQAGHSSISKRCPCCTPSPAPEPTP